MAMSEIRFHDLADGRRLAFRHAAGAREDAAPALVFLPGYKSDMAGSKAVALFDWAAANGRACLLLDYSGCGESSGEFADGGRAALRSADQLRAIPAKFQRSQDISV